jgi:hypothetical protein
MSRTLRLSKIGPYLLAMGLADCIDVPVYLPLVILIKCRLVMCDEDEWKWMRRRMCKHCASIRVVPNMEMLFVFGPLIDKHSLIGHYVVPFVAFNIHFIQLVFVFPVQFYKPTLCCRQGDGWFLNTELQEHPLN